MLIQHQLVKSHHYRGVNKRYTFAVGNMLLRARFPRYIHAAKVMFSDAGELVIEDLLQHGMSLMSQVRYLIPDHMTLGLALEMYFVVGIKSTMSRRSVWQQLQFLGTVYLKFVIQGHTLRSVYTYIPQ